MPPPPSTPYDLCGGDYPGFNGEADWETVSPCKLMGPLPVATTLGPTCCSVTLHPAGVLCRMPRQANTSAMRRRASREDELPIDFFQVWSCHITFDFSRWIIEVH